MSTSPARTACAVPGILRALGFVGMEPIEHALLAGIVTGDPILLVGAHGSAKTAPFARLAAALGLRFWAYDASKALFDDVIGFPNPFALKRGVVEYAPTPVSIWDKEFILIDEISRAAPSLANKWLEIVRSNRVMGKPIDGLRHVVAAMNPSEYLGAHPLDAALLGRFAWILRMPEACDMEEAELRAIAATATPDDARLVRGAFGAPSPGEAEAESTLRLLIGCARSLLPLVVKEQDARVTRYAAALALELRTNGVDLDGRRIGMLRRNILAALALARVATPGSGRSKLDEDASHARLIERMVAQSLPLAPVQEEPIDAATLAGAHVAAYELAFGSGRASRSEMTYVLGVRGLDDMFERYAERRAGLSESEQHEVLTRVLDSLSGKPLLERGGPLGVLVRLGGVLARDAATGPAPPDVVARALSTLWDIGGYGEVEPGEVHGALERIASPAIGDAADSLALRAAIQWTREKRPGHGFLDYDEVRTVHERLRRRLATGQSLTRGAAPDARRRE